MVSISWMDSMVRLSVNVNKVATLRNSRGGDQPRVLDAVNVCLAAGVRGITVHPRADQRHITPTDVRDIARRLEPVRPDIEVNMEGDPRPDFIELVHEVRPEQCTIVHCSGRTSWTSSMKSGRGSPSMLTSMSGRTGSSRRAMSRTSVGVMCRWSARG